MSKAQGRRVSMKDLEMVKRLIERCLELYMSQMEAAIELFHHAKIEPVFTEIVWQRLEAENEEFFRAYNISRMVKGQILRFNHLLQKQVHLMYEITHTPLFNGSQTHSMYVNMDPQPCINSEMMMYNGTYFPQQYMQLEDMVCQSSNGGTMQGFNNNVLEAYHYHITKEANPSPFDGGYFWSQDIGYR